MKQNITCSDQECTRLARVKGLCQMHYGRAVRRARGLRRLWRCSPEERFWYYTQQGEGCWMWTGSVGSGRYGVVDLGSPEGKRHSTAAHRFSWELHFGPIPDGVLVCHHCDNPPCVNPAHLFLGTIQENMDDRNNKMRHAHNERHGRAKLTLDQVQNIRLAFSTGVSKRSLSKQYGVVHSAIRSIIAGRTWKHD